MNSLLIFLMNKQYNCKYSFFRKTVYKKASVNNESHKTPHNNNNHTDSPIMFYLAL